MEEIVSEQMNNDQITNTTDDVERVTWFGYQSFIFTLVRALTISIGSYIMFTISQIDTHIATILGFFMAIIPFFMFMTISKNKYRLDIIDLNIKLFGKIFGNILNVVINVVFLMIGSLTLYTMSQYIDIQYIPNTSAVYVNLLIILPAIYAASKSIATISRISQCVLVYNLLIFILSIFGLVAEFDYNNFLPIFDKDVPSILHSGLIFALSVISPIFLMTIIPQSKVIKKEYNKKKMLLFFSVSVLVTIFIIVTTILIMGIDVINIYRYPIFMALRQFSLFTIFERLERFLSLQFLMDVIILLILTIYFVATSINKVFKAKTKENIFSYIVGIVIVIISSFIIKDNIKINEIVSKYYVWILLLGVILPMAITYIGVIIDNIKGKLNSLKNA